MDSKELTKAIKKLKQVSKKQDNYTLRIGNNQVNIIREMFGDKIIKETQGRGCVGLMIKE